MVSNGPERFHAPAHSFQCFIPLVGDALVCDACPNVHESAEPSLLVGRCQCAVSICKGYGCSVWKSIGECEVGSYSTDVELVAEELLDLKACEEVYELLCVLLVLCAVYDGSCRALTVCTLFAVDDLDRISVLDQPGRKPLRMCSQLHTHRRKHLSTQRMNC